MCLTCKSASWNFSELYKHVFAAFKEVFTSALVFAHWECWIPKLLPGLMLLIMHLVLSFLSILQILISILSHSILISILLWNSIMTFTIKNFSQSLRHSRFGDTTWRVCTFQWTLPPITRFSLIFPLSRSSLTDRLTGLNIYLSLISLFIFAWATSEQSQILLLDI